MVRLFLMSLVAKCDPFVACNLIITKQRNTIEDDWQYVKLHIFFRLFNTDRIFQHVTADLPFNKLVKSSEEDKSICAFLDIVSGTDWGKQTTLQVQSDVKFKLRLLVIVFLFCNGRRSMSLCIEAVPLFVCCLENTVINDN